MHAFRVYPTSAQNELMLDKANYPFIAENADGFNLQHDSFAPFSSSQVATIFNQFTNKNFINHGVYHGTDIYTMSTMTKTPNFANVTAFMLYNEAPAMDADEWTDALGQNVTWPLITHCRSYNETSTHAEIRSQIMRTSGIMMEFKVTDPGKYDDAAKLMKYCVDNDRMVVFLTTFQETPEIFISAYKEFYYYLKENLDPSYLSSDHVIFVPNTYSDDQVFPETLGYGSTFGVAHWLIDQKSKINDGYIQPKISFSTPCHGDYFENHSNIDVSITVTEATVSSAKLYINDVLVGEDTSAPYSWSGAELTDLTTGYHELRAVVTDISGVETHKSIRVKVLKDPPAIPGFFWADNLTSYQLRNDPHPDGYIRHVYGKEWVDYKVDVAHTGMYDVDVDLFVQRSKQFGGTIIIKKGTQELGRFTTVLNDPAQAPINGFTETPVALIKDIPLSEGLQTLRVEFKHPNGIIKPQFYLNSFNFMIQGAPEINFITPQKNEADEYNYYDAPAAIEIEAGITSPRSNGTIANAKLYINDVEVSTLTEAPFIWNNNQDVEALLNLPEGSYTIKIEATDDLGYRSFNEIDLKVIARQPFNTNLTIPGVIKAYEFDLGKEGIAYHDFNEGIERGLGGAQNPRYTKAGNEDVEIEMSAGSYSVSAVRNGEWLSYTMSSVEKGIYAISLNTSANAGKSADVRVWLNNKIITTVPISETANSGFTTYKNFTVSYIEILEDLEKANIRLEFINPSISNYLCFFKEFEFKKIADDPKSSDGTVQVNLTKPGGDITREKGYTLDVAVNASSSAGNISEVILFIDGEEVRRDNSAPYEWGHADSPNPQELNGLSPGEHEIKIVALDVNNNFGISSFKLMVEASTSAGSNVKATDMFSVYPNPMSTHLTVQLKQLSQADVFVYNIAGNLVYQRKNVVSQCVIDRNKFLNSGTYFIRIYNHKYGYHTQKMIVH
ncbi:Ig-like domain-containing protein [Saccharicrinis sp. GN24d3]|uniref:Ig-like domain-containing protein n=1 Tax=Saccharicrinis sp. 156 TaxID=3417574 RepID=UPI003D3463FC